MATHVSELSIEEFKELISESVRTSFEDMLEDYTAMGSPEFLRSIAEAREQYKRGDVTPLEQLSGV
ncbi:MAG: hypothetical protein GHCLOJNM_03551 [bacterium]|nr:hypothetical protein [bacterium]